jgi:hypothetical protein
MRLRSKGRKDGANRRKSYKESKKQVAARPGDRADMGSSSAGPLQGRTESLRGIHHRVHGKYSEASAWKIKSKVKSDCPTVMAKVGAAC